MIVYEALRSEFTDDVLSNAIEQRVLASFQDRLGQSTSKSEIESWKNSLQYVNNAVMAAGIPADAGVAIEYRMPQSSKRVDFILTGRDENNHDTAVIIELKQWSEASVTEKDAVVETAVGGGIREMLHPSYQAWTYAALIRDFNEAAHDGRIKLEPCAYLHNMQFDDAVKAVRYAEHLAKAPLFSKEDTKLLQAFLSRHIRTGDQKEVLYKIENGQLKPSKGLADHLASLLEGNREFELIDEQKLVYETALALSSSAQAGKKQVLVVEGGPGTGKSVVAINLLVAMTSQGLVSQYVTRNAAPRAVYETKLSGTMRKTHIGNMFKSSGAYIDAPEGQLDALIVDEAHRLNEKSGLYRNKGEHQVSEIIRASKFSVFFVDDDQRVTLDDIGEQAVICDKAKAEGASLTRLKLESQFRCNGSDGYLAWLNQSLGISATANTSLDGIDYDFQIYSSPVDLHSRVKLLNEINNKSRMVAGYCWSWKGKKDPEIEDIDIPEHGYSARWNLNSDGMVWILKPNSVDEVGCIHTCQGLELDYVGVIVGPDLVVRDGVVVTDATKRSSQDRSIFGYKKWAKEDPAAAKMAADRIIKNTYRTLMTRGQKGCFIYATDQETEEYFQYCVGSSGNQDLSLLAAEERGSY